jgi:hypothetical protein
MTSSEGGQGGSWPWSIRLGWFEAAKAYVPYALEACRSFNTLADVVFYNTPGLEADLAARQVKLETLLARAPKSAGYLDLSALDNPEGSLLVIDPSAPPYVKAFDDVQDFLNDADAQKAATITVTGVGSSALGSAALAWDVAKALEAPVAAIVPGYGIADVVLQALGGWYGFGLADALNAKTAIQNSVARVDPKLAALGRQLVMTTADPKKLENGAPSFRQGSGSSDVLHEILDKSNSVRRLVGHSKGALVIENAVRGLDPTRTAGLEIVTLGCPISKEIQGAGYHQYLGVWDWLGQLNSWGRQPSRWVWTEHTTNIALPLAMDAERLCEGALATPAAPL